MPEKKETAFTEDEKQILSEVFSMGLQGYSGQLQPKTQDLLKKKMHITLILEEKLIKLMNK